MGNNAILFWSIIVALGLSGLSLVAMGLFSLRNVSYGKVRPVTVVLVVAPMLLLSVLGFTMQTWAEAGVLTVVIMFIVSLLGLLGSGVRSLFL
ncbi:hypothetical protein CRI93_06105 [Longimonas halophila]|uniref:Uncharacterized protein n=1 Tax=Longimonas halophila TaxID=1469170 RepID=A0A2H3P6P8_9BACT|nr:hypothetical protein [Longimonas halophila]PEN08012.1 hypothetical protein CRI93_06105 [Longimonas halophila]